MKRKGGRPRGGVTVYIRDDGQSYLSRNALEELQEAAELRGIFRLRYIAWDMEKNTVILWPVAEKNEYSVSLNISGPRKTIQFKSRKLAHVAGTGKKKVKIII